MLLKRGFYYLQFLKGDMQCHASSRGEAPCLLRKQMQDPEENTVQSLHWVFHRPGKARQGKWLGINQSEWRWWALSYRVLFAYVDSVKPFCIMVVIWWMGARVRHSASIDQQFCWSSRPLKHTRENQQVIHLSSRVKAKQIHIGWTNHRQIVMVLLTTVLFYYLKTIISTDLNLFFLQHS